MMLCALQEAEAGSLSVSSRADHADLSAVSADSLNAKVLLRREMLLHVYTILSLGLVRTRAAAYEIVGSACLSAYCGLRGRAVTLRAFQDWIMKSDIRWRGDRRIRATRAGTTSPTVRRAPTESA